MKQDKNTSDNIITHKDYTVKGLHEKEKDAREFHWTRKEFEIIIKNKNKRYLTLELFSNFDDFSQIVSCYFNNKFIKKFKTIPGWGKYYLHVKNKDKIIFRLNKTVPEEIDARILGVRLGKIELTNKINTALTILDNKTLNYKEFVDKVIDVRSKPQLLTIETSATCNLNCVMCSRAISPPGRPNFLPTDMLRKLTSNINICSELQLHGDGEPTLSPAFWQALDKLNPETYSSFNTNGTVFNKDKIIKLLNSNIKVIEISLDAATKETYKKIRNFDFNKVIDNIRLLIRLKKEMKKEYPRIILNMTLMRENINEICSFVKLAKDIGANGIKFGNLNRWTEEKMLRYYKKIGDWIFDYKAQGLWEDPKLPAYIEKASQLAKELNLEFCTPIHTILIKENKKEQIKTVKHCTFPWTWAMITTDGDVRVCCFSNTSIGNLSQVNSIDDLWDNDIIKDLRTYISKNKIHPLCKDSPCAYVQNMINSGEN